VKFFSRKMLYIFCGALILVANGWLYFLGRVMAYDYRVWADSFVQFECFSAGILLCLALRGRIPRIAPWERLILLTCAVCSWFISVHTLHANFGVGENPGSWPLIGGYALAAIGSVLVLVAFLGVNPKLLPGWAIHLGRISFGLYVFHEFAISLTIHLPFGALLFKTVSNYPIRICLNAGLTLGLPVGLTLLMAEFSYRYIETPFLKMKKRHTVIESQPILGAS
jgi:peptidoglycan/LPS O-acetylase OafA/YrhL